MNTFLHHRLVRRACAMLSVASVLAWRSGAAVVAPTETELLSSEPAAEVPALPKEARPETAARMKVRTAALKTAAFRITLPNGQSVPVLRDEFVDFGGGDGVWKGRVAAEPLSRVNLAIRNGVVSGVIDRAFEKGNEIFEITPTPDGGTLVYQIDSSVPLPCGHQQISLGNKAARAAKLGLKSSKSMASSLATEALSSTPVQVDVMVVYSTASRVRYGQAGIESKILTAITDANTGFANSLINLSFKLVYMGEVAYTETGDMTVALSALSSNGDGIIDSVHALRTQYGADLVCMIDEDSNYGGYGYVMTSASTSYASYAFSVVYSGALSQYSLTHEMGHNMGCQHDRANATFQGATPYSYGWRVCVSGGTGFRSIMSYACSGVPRINYFSNPSLTYLGSPLGVDYATDPANASDNSRTLRETAATVASFMPTAPTTAPAAPSTPVATATSPTSVGLSWTDNASNEQSYTVERSSDGNTFAPIASLAANTASYADTSAAAATTYWYRIAAVNTIGKASSGAASVTTPTPPPAPIAPTSLASTAVSSSQINLSWIDNATNESGYYVDRSSDGVTFTRIATLAAGAVSYSSTGLTSGATYWYRVCAYNSGGISDASNISTATTLLALPAAPSRLTLGSITSSQMTLSWTDNSSNESGFRIERSLNGSSYTEIAVVGPNIRSFVNTGLTANTAYYFRVRAYNAAGNSAYASASSKTKR